MSSSHKRVAPLSMTIMAAAACQACIKVYPPACSDRSRPPEIRGNPVGKEYRIDKKVIRVIWKTPSSLASSNSRDCAPSGKASPELMPALLDVVERDLADQGLSMNRFQMFQFEGNDSVSSLMPQGVVSVAADMRSERGFLFVSRLNVARQKESRFGRNDDLDAKYYCIDIVYDDEQVTLMADLYLGL